jgi:hypothetical protein
MSQPGDRSSRQTSWPSRAAWLLAALFAALLLEYATALIVPVCEELPGTLLCMGDTSVVTALVVWMLWLAWCAFAVYALYRAVRRPRRSRR